MAPIVFHSYITPLQKSRSQETENDGQVWVCSRAGLVLKGKWRNSRQRRADVCQAAGYSDAHCGVWTVTSLRCIQFQGARLVGKTAMCERTTATSRIPSSMNPSTICRLACETAILTHRINLEPTDYILLSLPEPEVGFILNSTFPPQRTFSLY